MSELLQIEEIARIKQGRYTAPSELTEEPTDDAKVPVWGANGILGYTQHATYDEAQPLVTCRGNGCGLVQWTGVRSHVSNNAMAIVLKDVCPASSKYLYYSLLASKFDDVTTGSAQPQITVGHLNKKEIFWNPDRSERIAIAHILGTLDDKIELNQKINQTLEDIAKAIFKSWFVDFDPVRAKVEGRSTGLPDEISDLFPDELEESEIGEIPAGWELKELSHALSLDSGFAYKGNLKGEGDRYLMTMGCVSQTSRCDEKGIHKYGGDFKGKSLVNPGDICISSHDLTQAREHLGAPFIVPNTVQGVPTAAATNTFIVRATGTLPSEFIIQTMRTQRFRNEMIACAKGSVILHISKGAVTNYQYAHPCAELIDKFALMMVPIIQRLDYACAENRILSELRDTLLPKLISGELCIPDAEKFLEEAGI